MAAQEALGGPGRTRGPGWVPGKPQPAAASGVRRAKPGSAELGAMLPGPCQGPQPWFRPLGPSCLFPRGGRRCRCTPRPRDGDQASPWVPRQQPQPQLSATSLLSSWMWSAPFSLSRGPPCRMTSSVATLTKASSTLLESLADVSMAHRMS